MLKGDFVFLLLGSLFHFVMSFPFPVQSVSGGARKFMELEQKIYSKFTCDIIYKQS